MGSGRRQQRTRSWSTWTTEEEEEDRWSMSHREPQKSQTPLLVSYLDDGRVLRKRAWWFGRLTDGQVLNVAASEDDVLEGVVSRRDGSVGGTVLCAEGPNCGGRNSFRSGSQVKG